MIAFPSTELDYCSRAPELVALIEVQRDLGPRYLHFPDVLAQRARETAPGREQLLAALRDGDGERAERVHRHNVARLGSLLAVAMQRERSSSDQDLTSTSKQRG